jgi:hypothetical protein
MPRITAGDGNQFRSKGLDLNQRGFDPDERSMRH